MLNISIWSMILYIMTAYAYKWIMTVVTYPEAPLRTTLRGITLEPDMLPPLSVIVPIYNQEVTVVTSIISALHLSYPDFEIIVVNDGSTDNSLHQLINHFILAPFPDNERSIIPTRRIRAIYRSITYPQLHVIDKDRGGLADALNAGINVCHHGYFIQQ